MAISAGTETKDNSGVAKQLFTGVTPVKVLIVNPSKTELESIYGRVMDKAPEYLTADDKGLRKLRFDFFVQTVPNEKMGVEIEVVDKMSFFMEDRIESSKDGLKAKVINAYGDTQWATQAQVEAGKLADNLSFFDTLKMRPAYVGEETLVNFIKQFCGIPNKGFDGVNIPDITKAEIQLDNIKDYFKGDISEVTSAINALKGTNIVKVAAGIKTTDDNKQYQAWFIQKPLKFGVRDLKYLLRNIKDRQDNGSYPNVDFGPEDLKFRLFNVEPTVIAPQVAVVANDPFATSMNTGVPANAQVVAAATTGSWFESK